MANNDNERVTSSSVSVGNWMWTLLLEKIPVVNLITFLVTALGSKKPSKRNWGYAHALLQLILSILIVIALAVGGFFLSKYINTPISQWGNVSNLFTEIADNIDADKADTSNTGTTEDTTSTDDGDIFATPVPNSNAG